MSADDQTAGVAGAGGNEHTTLGQLLSQARESRQLSVEDLAQRLRLEPRMIRALEADDEAKLPAPAFVRGYVRSIAKELNVDDTPFLNVFDLRSAHEPPPLADFESRAPSQIDASSVAIRYTSIAIGVLTIVLIVLWWLGRDEPSADLTDLLEEADSETLRSPTPPLPYEFDVVEHSEAPIYRAPPAEVVHPTDEREARPIAIGASEPGEQTNNDAERSAAPAADNNPPAAVANELVLRPAKDAWVDVRDGNGERLFFDTAKAGRELRLNGALPYQLVLGNAESVEVEFNGQAFDTAAHSTEGVARFKLGD